MKFKIILFYKYIPVTSPEALKKEQQVLCQNLGLRGRIIVAKEGINGTLEGKEEDIKNYELRIKNDKRFADTHFKISDGTGDAFSKLSVKVRDEIVAGRLGEDDVKPWEITGKYLSPEELHSWYESGKKFFIVDIRNNFEQEVGSFENSYLSEMGRFDQLPNLLPKLKALPAGVPVVTVCTGGVRCEKASGFLIKNGFNDVYQLYGGIHSYMEKYPQGHFKGALYVFDQRVVISFNDDLKDPERSRRTKREIVGKCTKCQKPSENFINCADPFCNRHMIVCKNCLVGKEKILCPQGCRDYSTEHPESALR